MPWLVALQPVGSINHFLPPARCPARVRVASLPDGQAASHEGRPRVDCWHSPIAVVDRAHLAVATGSSREYRGLVPDCGIQMLRRLALNLRSPASRDRRLMLGFASLSPNYQLKRQVNSDVAKATKNDPDFRLSPNDSKTVVNQSKAGCAHYSERGWVGRPPPGTRIDAKCSNAGQDQSHANELQAGQAFMQDHDAEQRRGDRLDHRNN